MRRHAFYHHNKSPHSVTCGFSSFVSDFFPPCRLQNSPCKTKLRPSPRWSCGCFKKVSELKKNFWRKFADNWGGKFYPGHKKFAVACAFWLGSKLVEMKIRNSSRTNGAHPWPAKHSLASLSLPRCALQFVSRAALVHACWLARTRFGWPAEDTGCFSGFPNPYPWKAGASSFLFPLFPLFFSFCHFLFHFSFFFWG